MATSNRHLAQVLRLVDQAFAATSAAEFELVKTSADTPFDASVHLAAAAGELRSVRSLLAQHLNQEQENARTVPTV